MLQLCRALVRGCQAYVSASLTDLQVDTGDMPLYLRRGRFDAVYYVSTLALADDHHIAVNFDNIHPYLDLQLLSNFRNPSFL